MSKKIKEGFNAFFVGCFNTILLQEERALDKISNGKLSMKEIHLIEAINRTQQKNENTSSGVAKYLNITLGSLTVAVNVLEKKGYIIKTRDEKDKRIIYLTLTDLGRYVNSCHEVYHEKMISEVIVDLDKNEQTILLSALLKLKNYFNN